MFLPAIEIMQCACNKNAHIAELTSRIDIIQFPRVLPIAVSTLVLDNNTQERDGEQAWAHHCHMRPPEIPKQVPLRREPSFEKEPSDLGLGST